MGGTGLPIVSRKQSTSSYPIPVRSKTPANFHRPQRFDAYTPTHDGDEDNDNNNTDAGALGDGDGKSNIESSRSVVPISTLIGPTSSNDDNNNNDDDGDGRYDPMTSVCVDPDDRYSALVTVHYYDVVEKAVTPSEFISIATTSASVTSATTSISASISTPTRTPTTTTTTITTMAEVNVSISPLGKQFGSSASGHTAAEYTHVPLFANTTTTTTTTHNHIDKDDQHTHQQPKDEQKAQTQAETEADDWSVDDKDWEVVDSMLSEQSSHSTSNTNDNTGNGATPTRQYRWTDVTLEVVFASDGKHLACLIPCPIPHINQSHTTDDAVNNDTQYRKTPPISKLLIFTLRQRYRRTQGDTIRTPPPLPHYIQPTPSPYDDQYYNLPQQQNRPTNIASINTNDDNNTNPNPYNFRQPDPLPPIILDAHILSLPDDDQLTPAASLLLTQITTICNAKVPLPRRNNVNRKYGYCLLMAGCTDGSIVAVGYRRSKLLAIPYRPPSHLLTTTTTTTRLDIGTRAVRSMVHHHRSRGNADGDVGGRLIVIRADGKVLLYTTSFGMGGTSDFGGAAITTMTTTSTEEDDDNADIGGDADDSNTGIGGKDDLSSTQNQQQQHKSNDPKTNDCHKNDGVDTTKTPNSTATIHNDTTLPPSQPTTTPSHPQRILRPSNRIRINVTPHGKLPDTHSLLPQSVAPPFARAIFIDYSRVAFLVDPVQNFITKRNDDNNSNNKNNNAEPIIAQVWHLADDSDDVGHSKEVYAITQLLASLTMTSDKLDELRHGMFTSDMSSSSSSSSSNGSCGINTITCMSDLSIHCDRDTNCLALSSAVTIKSRNNHDTITGNTDNSDLLTIRPFVSLWDWRLSVSGFTLMGDSSTESKMVIVDCGGGRVGLAHRCKHQRTTGVVSHVYFCHNRNGGGDQFTLAHIRKTTTGGRHFKKDLYSWGVLSPSEVVSAGGTTSSVTPRCKFEQPNPILIMYDSISFPYVVAPMSCKDFTIQWKESNIPTTYSSLYGSIRTAAIGRKHGRSIAVAASRGLCVFDLSSRSQEEENASKALSTLGPSIIPTPCILGRRCDDDEGSGGVKSNTPKWRMFRESDERSFSVRAMTWWERSSTKGEVSEDLLIAVVEYHIDGEGAFSWNGSNRDDDEEDNDGETTQCYLVCWSRRRLGRGSLQLLQEASSSRFEDRSDIIRAGVPLKKGFIPASISLLAEPREKSGSHDNDDRAVLLLGSKQQQSDHDNRYLAYQLQVASTTREDQQRRQNGDENGIIAESGGNDVVLANLCSSGLVDSTLLRQFSSSTAISPCGIFIAGASFQFDLVKDHSHEISGSNANTYIATLGVICAMGKTVFSVTVAPLGLLTCACLYESDVSKNIHPTVQRYWIADTVIVKTKGHRCQFVWTIAKSDGCNFTWSVPFFQYQRVHNDDPVISMSTEHDMADFEEDGDKSIKVKPILLDVLLPITENIPSHCQSTFAIQKKISDLHGTVFHDGDILHGCVTDESEILLGPMPSIYCQFVFYVGQASRNIQGGQVKSHKMQLYGLTDCVVGPPTFVASLFIDLSEDDTVHHLHSTHTIQKFKYFDTSMVTVRTIVTCLTVFISSITEKSDEAGVGGYEVNSLVNIVEDVLSRILTFARESMSDIHFASLFLSTGRQLEPHQCNHLFPLLLSTHPAAKSLISDIEDISISVPLSITVQDLYSSAVAAGSLTVAASALPLFAVQQFTQKQCIMLLHHSISTILRLCTLDGEQCISCISEECLFIRQLYLYGLKLEDSAGMLEFDENSSNSEVCTNADLYLSEDDSSDTEKSHVTSSYSGSILKDQDDNGSSTQKTIGSPSRVLQLASTLFSPIKVFNDAKEEKQSEIEISKAASSFIFSGYYDGIYEIEGNPSVSAESDDTKKYALFEEVSHLQLDVSTNEYGPKTRPILTIQRNEIGIAETIGFAIVSSMFHPSAIVESSASRLNKVAILCLLLQYDSPERNPIDVDTSLSNLTKRLSEDSYQKSVECICHLQVGHDNVGYLNEGGVLSSVKSLTTSLMLLCVDHWDDDIASTVFQMMISLLTQNNNDRLSEITPLLVLVALSAGHACQKAEILFGSDCAGTSPLEKLYHQCVEKL